MARTKIFRDENYTLGMNSLDDAQTLKDGECAELINALPDFPIKMRNGCVGKQIAFGDDNEYEIASKTFVATFKPVSGKAKESLFFWATKDNLAYLFVVEDIDNKEMNAAHIKYQGDTGDVYFRYGVQDWKDPLFFDFVQIEEVVYARAQKEGGNGWNDTMWAVEYMDLARRWVARLIPGQAHDKDMPFVSFNSITTGGKVLSGDMLTAFRESFLFGYSISLVRRIEEGNGIKTTFAHGLIETPELTKTRAYIEYNKPESDDAEPVQIYISLEFQNGSSPELLKETFGFTHVRLYRTANLYGVDNVEVDGADRYFLVDIPIEWFMDGNTAGGLYVNNGAFIDGTDPALLDGEKNLLTSFMYSLPPWDGYKMLYFKKRLFLMGSRGNVFYSATIGEDGGGDLETAQYAANKYAMWFKPLHYRIELDIFDNTASTGLDSFGEDVYLFKENKVFMIPGGDPTPVSGQPVRIISDKIGCEQPESIRKAVVFGQEVLFYLSDAGPMLITTGGNIRPFLEFKVKELWANIGNGGFIPQEERPTVSATFWNSTLWVFYLTPKGDNKIFGYHSAGDNNGAFEIRIADIQNKFVITNLAVTEDNKAVTVANLEQSGAATVDFLGAATAYDSLSKYNDTVFVSDAWCPIFGLLSRKVYPGVRDNSISELFTTTVYCVFSVYDLEDAPFLVEVTSNRYKARQEFSEVFAGKSTFQTNHLGTPVAGTSQDYTFTRSDDGEWKAATLAGYVAYLYTEALPDNGVYVNVRTNGLTILYFDFDVGWDYEFVRLIGKPITRTNIQFVPCADFIGEWFQFRVEKRIPEDRRFNLYKIEMEFIPRPQLGSDTFTGGEPNRASWE